MLASFSFTSWPDGRTLGCLRTQLMRSNRGERTAVIVALTYDDNDLRSAQRPDGYGAACSAWSTRYTMDAILYQHLLWKSRKFNDSITRSSGKVENLAYRYYLCCTPKRYTGTCSEQEKVNKEFSREQRGGTPYIIFLDESPRAKYNKDDRLLRHIRNVFRSLTCYSQLHEW